MKAKDTTFLFAKKKFDILIPVYKLLDVTTKCIDLLYKFGKDKFNLIVLNNAPEPAINDYLNSHCDIVINSFLNLGVPESWNLLLRISVSPLIILMNNDVYIYSTNFLEIVETQLKNYDLIGLTAGVIGDEWVGVRHTKNPMEKMAYIEGNCLCFDRDVIDNIGYFNEIYSPFLYEDTDWSFEAKIKGLKLGLIDNVQYEHLRETTFKAFNIDSLSVRDRNLIIFKEKWQTKKYLL